VGTVQLRVTQNSVSDGAGVTAPASNSGTANTFRNNVTGFGANLYITVSPDGTKGYVSNRNTNQIQVFNTQTNTIIAAISGLSDPRGIVASPDGQFVYVANYGASTISKIATSSNSIVATISVSSSPQGLAISNDGSKVLVASYGTNNINVISTANNTVTTIPIGRTSWSIAVSPDGNTAYSANVSNSSITIINLVTNAVSYVSVGVNPYEVGISRDGTLVFASNYSSNSISVISTSSNAVIRTLTGVAGPMGIVTSVDDSTVYVASYGSHRVYWFASTSSSIPSNNYIETQNSPRGLVLSADGSRGYSSNQSGSSVTVFNAQGEVQSSAITIDRTAPTASFTTVPANYLSSASSTFTITFNEAITGLQASDFTNAGTAQNCVITPASATGTAINVTVASCGDGTLDLQLAANAVADTAGNTGPATTVTAPSRYVDGFPGAPTASFTSTPTSPNNSQTLTYQVTFNEAISGFTGSDLTNIGTATNCEYTVTGTEPGTVFLIEVTNCSDGTVLLRINNASVTDRAGNTGPGSGGAENSLATQVNSVGSTMYSAVHPDGSKVYIASEGNAQVRVLNTQTNSITNNISVGSTPRGIAVSPDGNFVYVANYSSNTVSKISTATNTVVATITVGRNPVGLTITPDGSKVIVANYSGASLSIINTSTNIASTTINLSRNPWNVKISPDGRTAYTANVGNSSVSVVNLTNNTVTTHINVGSSPYEVGINRSGTRVYAANYGSSSVSVIDTSNNTVIRTITGITNPMGIVTSLDDQTVYVASYGSQRLRWFNATTYAVNSEQIVAGSAAWGVSLAPDGSRGYVSNLSSGTVTVFNAQGFVQSQSVTRDVSAPTLASFTNNTNSPNDLTEQSWTLTFSESVTGLAADDFTVGGTSSNWGDITVTGSGASYTVSVSNPTPTAGTITLQLAANAVADTAGNTGPASAQNAPQMKWALGQGVFKIESLSTSNITAVDINSTVGDDRGGIALTTNRVLVNGDSALGRFDINNLATPTQVATQDSTWMDGIVTDIKTLKSYAFNLNSARSGSLSKLTLLDENTGLRTSTDITLSSAIPVANQSALFSGYGRVAIWTGGRLYDISLPSGQVTNYGTFSMPSRQSSEAWATWGVIEYFSGQLHLVYVQNGTTIARVNVATGSVSTVASSSAGFSDMASFTVNPRANRWYFRYEGRAGAFNFGSAETVGHATASFNVGGEAPEPITGLQLSTRSSIAVASWNAPTEGPTPTDYVLQYSRDAGATWVWVNDGVSTSTSASIQGFTPGDIIRFRVATVSDVNASTFTTSDDSMVSPYPTAPSITSISTANAALAVNFTAPTSRGASAISNYQYSLDGGTTWTSRSPAATTSPLVISELTNGTEYSVIIRAVNTQGSGEASNSVSATPFTTPSAPTITSVTPSASGTLTINFSAPTSDGGNAITNYQYSINNGSTWISRSPASTSNAFNVAGLANGSSYTIVLRAVNSRGTGPSSTAVVAAAGIPPGAPTITNLTTGDASINVTFNAPSYNGGLPITNYQYSLDGTNWITRSPASTTSPLVITGLTNGTSNTVQIRAVNLAGSGATSGTRTGTPSRTPDAPTIDAIESSSQRLRIAVTAPQFDGGAAISNYQYSINNGATWTALNPVSTTGVFTITGLTNAQTYPIRVRAVNFRGAGDASTTMNGTPATTPGAPTITSISSSPQTLTVSFTPGTTGGAVPTNYEYSINDGATWTAASPATTVSPLTISDLTNGTTYTVRVRAVNSQGAGGASAAMDATPATVPSAPTISSIAGSNGRITVSISNGFDGGAAITNYQYSTDDGTTWTTRSPASGSSPLVIAGLTNAIDYDVRVRSINAQGVGAASSAVVGRPATVPNAPTITTVSPDPGVLEVAFATPNFDGGNTITNYEYSTDGGTTWTTRSPASTTSPMTITGLTDGTTYAIRIRAINAQGSGISSAAIDGTPENVPGAPTITNVVSGNQSLRVEFSSAAPRGRSVTNYEYSLDNGDNWITRDPVSTQSPIVIEGLTNGTTYPIKVRGVNSRGVGIASASVDAIPSTPPGAPTITFVRGGIRQDETFVGSGNLEVEFTSGTSGGAPITATQYSLDGGTSWTNANQATSPITITGLTNGVTYPVRLRHVNVRGAGVSSTSTSGAPTTTPGAPTLQTIRSSNQTLTLFVTPPTTTGGTAITTYEYLVDNGEAGTWVRINPNSTSMPIVVTEFKSDPDATPIQLENGTTYAISVRARNANGVGESSETRSAKPSTTPGAPTITSITGTSGQLSVAFAAPTNNGGEQVTNYQYSIDGGQTWTNRSPVSAESPLVISGLTNGTDYSIKVRAVNVQGAGTASNTVTGRPAAPPSAPTINSITSTNGGLSVVFTPGFDGGASVSNIEYSTNNGTNWVTLSPASTSRPLAITGLTNGTEYQVRVRLVNAQGSGTESTAVAGTPATTPSVPTILTITPQDGALGVTLSAPANNGGATVTAYQYSTDNGATWSSTQSSNTSFSISSLTNGTAYQVKVRAINRMGSGDATSATTATPSRVADAPTIASISSGNQKLTVVFTENFNGGAPTSNLQYSIDGGTTWTTRSSASTSSPLVISGLTNGTSYQVRLRMINPRGNGAASTTSTATPATTPAAPTIGTVTVASRKLTVAVTAPSDNGGNAITNYEYSLDKGASWTPESTVIDTGSFDIEALTNGTTYNIIVRAVNSFGPGASSNANQGTPATAPSMPVILSTTPLNQSVTLEFALGPTGGSTITNIEYSINDGASWTTRSPASTTSPLVIDGLQNGVTYPIRVRAVNARGAGVASRTSGTPATTPSDPTITRIAAGDGTLTVEFEPPEDNGGALVTNYQYSLNGGTWIPRSPSSDESPLTITGLTNGTTYAVRLRAVNSQGLGSESEPVEQSPARVPGATTISGSTVSDSTINIGYSVSDNGGRTISAIDYSLDNGESWTTVLAPTSPITVENLTNGTGYSVKLRARNQMGIGIVSDATVLTPARAPDAPTIAAITRGDTTLSVAYILGGNGGDPITDVEYTVDNGMTWLQQSSISAQSPLTISGLSNGTSYNVKIRAVNTQGGGTDSNAMSGMPAGAPSAPTISSATRANAGASIAFVLGNANGDDPSNIEYSIDNGVTWTTQSPASVTSPLTLTNLVNGTTYNVRVRAVNAMGTSSSSDSAAVTPAAPPSAPTMTSVVGEDSRAVVSFTPNGDGGDAITNYAYSTNNGDTWTTLSPASTQSPIIISGLTNGSTYNVRLRAINTVSEGEASTPTAVTPSGPPLAPTITSITGSDETLSISFNAGGNGGVAISAYQISTDGGSTWTDATGTTSPLSISGLENGATYSVAIKALNTRGAGTTSNTVSGVPATVPDAPQITEVISDSGAVHLGIMFGGNGGNPISNIEYSIDNGVNWITRSPASTSRPLTIAELTNGTTYTVRIRTVNEIGASDASEPVEALPATTPSAPTITSRTSGNGTLLVHFDAPSSNGGAQITHYQYSLDGGSTWVDTPGNSSPIEITNVTIGTVYEVDLRAVNFRGAGADIQSAAKLVTAPPAPPTITTAETGNGEISVRYAPPTDTGGTTIESYEYSLDGGETWDEITQQMTTPSVTLFSMNMPRVGVASTTTSVQNLNLTGLVNGQTYNVTIRATHSEAIGLPSSSFRLVPSTTPGVVRNVVAESSDESLTISFDAPSDNGGRAISNYEFTLDGGATWMDVPENPFMITGLENGEEYDVRVRSYNGNGAGISSAQTMAVPSTTASAPGRPQGTAGIRSAELTWTAPSDDGGSAITDYVIQYSTNDGNTWQDVDDTVSTATSVLISSLTGGQTYRFRVIPINLAGRGAPSDASEPITPASPASITGDTVDNPVAAPVVATDKTEKNTRRTTSSDNNSADENDDVIDGVTDFETSNQDNDDNLASPEPKSPSKPNEPATTNDSTQLAPPLVVALAIVALIGVLGIGIAGIAFSAGPVATNIKRVRVRHKNPTKKP
jgi:YVTN family beta-propeller protein